MKTIFYNIIVFLLLLILGEAIFGYWFTKDNFGIYMRKERNKNWKTISSFNNTKYDFFYKRNFYGFRGDEFDPKKVEIIFEGGSTANQRYTPEEFTIVGQLNKKFESDKINIKIYNAATDGKSLRGIIYDFVHWFPKINNFKPKYAIFYLGINERMLADQIEEKMYDLHIQEKKIARIKDYTKNNSFIYDKYKTMTNKYFPKDTGGYFFNNEKLYNNFTYTNYKQAKNLKREIFDEDNKIVEQFEKRLLILEDIMKSNNLIPIFITQVAYDGLSNQKLFLINESLKKFSKNKNYHLIKLDEIIEMELYDFYDNVHTTPKGSKKIAHTIYPLLKKIFTN